MRRLLPFLFVFLFFFLLISSNAYAMRVIPYKASPDQVLVLYNADWQPKTSALKKTSGMDNESEELARYYVRMHTDDATGKRPYMLGLKCRHKKFDRDLNNWYIKEISNDNSNAIRYKGKGRAPRGTVLRDLRKVEIKIDEPEPDLDSIQLSIRSKLTKENITVPKAFAGDVKVKGYYIKKQKTGFLLSLDASRFFSGSVTVSFSIKDTKGKTIKSLKLAYYDYLDFEFSEKGPDGIADDKILEEDILGPVREFLEDPKNALPSGLLLKDHILYIVVMRGMPISAKGVYGAERGATANRGDHGARGSLQQRIQTIYYDWNGRFRPPVVVMPMKKGPDSALGVVNYVITTALRGSQVGLRWNPYMHKDAYSYTSRRVREPDFYQLAPLRVKRELVMAEQFAYGVTRIEGRDLEDAKRIIDYSLYASKYLRPEMDCRVRAGLAADGKGRITDLAERMRRVEEEGLWGADELNALGFITQIDKSNYKDHKGQGVPFLVRPLGEDGSCAKDTEADWRATGFYPGGMHRHVESGNGLNYYGKSSVWQQLKKGVTLTAAGAPAYSGGPHITNATFWDNRILMRYLLRGRDLGGALLNSTLYVNWSTSLIGDPLLHPDLSKTKIDRTPPELDGELSFEQYAEFRKVFIEIEAKLKHTQEAPEVALLKAAFKGAGGDKVTAISPLYSARPRLTVEGLKPGSEYSLILTLIDPYGNERKLEERPVKTRSVY